MSSGDNRNIQKVYVAGRESPPSRSGTFENLVIQFAINLIFFSMLDITLYLAGEVVNLINDSPRVEGNNITVDLRTDHPVQCGIRLATMASPLRDCECMSILLHGLHMK